MTAKCGIYFLCIALIYWVFFILTTKLMASSTGNHLHAKLILLSSGIIFSIVVMLIGKSLYSMRSEYYNDEGVGIGISSCNANNENCGNALSMTPAKMCRGGSYMFSGNSPRSKDV